MLVIVILLVFAASATFAVLSTDSFDRRIRFELTGDDGMRVSEADFHGKYALVFFGFTHCPMICPTQMAKITAIVESLDGRLAGKPLVPVFISIDPARDTVDRVGKYVDRFHPAFVGLTGHRIEIARAARSFRTTLPPSARDPATNYDIAHPAILYLVSPEGNLLAHVPYGVGATEGAARLREAAR